MRIPRWRPDRRITEQAPSEARRLYVRYRLLTWVGHVTLNLMGLSLVAMLISLKKDVVAYDTVMAVFFVGFFGSLVAYPAGEHFMNKLEREFPGAVLVEAETSSIGADEGAAEYSYVEGASVAATTGRCHLLDDITRSGWPRPDDAPMFADDDLRIRSATCSCGRLYLLVWRRVPRSYFEYLVPVEASELCQVQGYISSAPLNVTDRWIAAEQAVTTLALQRPTIEYSPFPTEVLRWLPPGELLAFTTSPY